MNICESILDAVGNTPMLRLRGASSACRAHVFAKLEYMNPGGSTKDRMVRFMLSEMECKGELHADTVLIENSSGNTGAALSMASAVKKLRCIVTIPDKMSREKISRMKAYGTEVVVAPTAVDADDPRSYYSVARRLADTFEGAVYMDQYNNPLNAQAHYESTGPEIWAQMDGNIDVFVSGIGTGGTISGVGRFLKEKNPAIKIIAADPIGSVFHDYFHHKKLCTPHTYKVEGIGEDCLVKAIDFSVIDDIVQINDEESFLYARRLAREEGVLCGGSSGSALAALHKVAERFHEMNVVVLLPDSGNMYLSKFLDDEWMMQNGYVVKAALTADEALGGSA